MKIAVLLPFVLAAALAAPAAPAGDDAEEVGIGKDRPPEGSSVAAVRDVREMEKEVRDLRADINILNLVNGLHLTPHQIVHLLRAAGEAKDLIEEAAPPPRMEKLLDREVRALERIRAAMLAGEEAPKEALRDLDNLRARGHAPRRSFRDVSERIRALEDGLEAELLPSQLEVVRTYKACLVPPKDLRDPVRVGQASDAGPMIRLLERVVRVPGEKWAREGAALVDRVVDEEQEHFGRYNEIETTERKAALRAAFEEARGMDEATFRMRKELLGERIQPEDRLQAIHLELQDLAESRGEPGKVARILLDPRVVPILRKRLEMLRTAARTPVNLESVQEADRCRDGRCAVRREKTE